MNLVRKNFANKSEFLIGNFKEKQYSKIKYFIENCINYLSRLNNNYLHIRNIEIENQIGYHGLENTQIISINVYVNDIKTNNDKLFVKLLMPTLLESQYFIISDNLYSPMIYIIDKPISLKEKSIKIMSLFNSISIYTKEDFATFTGVNIPLNIFLQLFIEYDKDIKLYNDFQTKRKLEHVKLNDDDITNYFRTTFNINSKKILTKEYIIEILEKIFLDEYTKELYKKCYTDLNEISLKNIIIYTLKTDICDKHISFINLRNKRLVFMEILLSPLFERIAKCIRTVRNNNLIDQISLDQLEIIKYFTTTKDPNKSRKGLNSNLRYDTVNLYGGMINHKISMVSPGIKNPPKSISSIHPSHVGILCPITISNQDPGETVSILPQVEIDEYGLFKGLI